MPHQQEDYNALFGALAARLRSDDSARNGHGVWEVRQESPPGAYLHASRPNWRDERMDGLHLEAYVLGRQLRSQRGLVALHCEGRWPAEFRRKFGPLLRERLAGALEEWNRRDDDGEDLGRWRLLPAGGTSLCEADVPFGSDPEETVRRMERQLRRLMTLSDAIDEAIDRCLEAGRDGASPPPEFAPERVRARDGKDGRELWCVVDGYVVDATDFARSHPGGTDKILAADDRRTGHTGEEFGFSLGRGGNAHFPRTARKFEEGAKRFEKTGRRVSVDCGPDQGGAITILGKLSL